MYDIEKYMEALSVEEALDYLAENPDAVIIAGGTDVLIRLHKGKLAEAHLMGIGRIEKLKGINRDNNGDIHIGPLTTYSMLENDPVVLENIPFLSRAAGSVGGPQIRNTATIGGNLCNGAPSADSAPVLMCLNAVLTLQSAGGKRTVPIRDFYTGPGRVLLHKGEMLTCISVQKSDYKGCKGEFFKFSQREAMDISTLNCAVSVWVENSCFSDMRIAYGVAAPTPVRCETAEKKAKGMEVTRENIGIIGKAVLEDIMPRDSWRGSKAFRLHLAEVMAVRNLCRLTGIEE